MVSARCRSTYLLFFLVNLERACNAPARMCVCCSLLCWRIVHIYVKGQLERLRCRVTPELDAWSLHYGLGARFVYNKESCARVKKQICDCTSKLVDAGTARYAHLMLANQASSSGESKFRRAAHSKVKYKLLEWRRRIQTSSMRLHGWQTRASTSPVRQQQIERLPGELARTIIGARRIERCRIRFCCISRAASSIIASYQSKDIMIRTGTSDPTATAAAVAALDQAQHVLSASSIARLYVAYIFKSCRFGVYPNCLRPHLRYRTTVRSSPL
ncbi:unnamed protein product [Trichogramma brassicae]|uniref:Secreted protein n=1 Tax=Trichogramma brassicae TaxID=86971 RepID=A0A6H5IIF7_9HYME|nr:unnamed protein product [Trichogramma brassicae]